MIIDPTKPITIEEIIRVAKEYEDVSVSPSCVEFVRQSSSQIEKIIEQNEPVYGINTGYGIFADKRIENHEISQLNRNLILSHAIGFGEFFEKEVVRAAMLVRANTLAKGFSGVRIDLINVLVDMLNRQVTPMIQSQGSLGSSGDLCLLAQLALVATNDEKDLEKDSGKAEFEGKLLSGKKAMSKAGIPRIRLGPKEGLAITNGATFSAALAALILLDAEYLIDVADAAAAISMEALASCSAALDDRIHQARNQVGQVESARIMRNLTRGSTLLDSTSKVQDAYSLRCAPQVHGAVRDTLRFVKEIIEREVNAATDNPLIFSDGSTLSGGNFHGEIIGMGMDYLSIAMCELAAISERRIARLIDTKLSNGLPAMLLSPDVHAGLNSGLMIPHYTAASLVLENQTLATPDSIRSLPTSANQEDHNANSTTAARHAWQIVQNCRQILSIELYAAAAGIDLRLSMSQDAPGEGTRKLFTQLRGIVPFLKEDSIWTTEIDKINQLLKVHNLRAL